MPVIKVVKYRIRNKKLNVSACLYKNKQMHERKEKSEIAIRYLRIYSQKLHTLAPRNLRAIRSKCTYNIDLIKEGRVIEKWVNIRMQK